MRIDCLDFSCRDEVWERHLAIRSYCLVKPTTHPLWFLQDSLFAGRFWSLAGTLSSSSSPYSGRILATRPIRAAIGGSWACFAAGRCETSSSSYQSWVMLKPYYHLILRPRRRKLGHPESLASTCPSYLQKLFILLQVELRSRISPASLYQGY